MNSLSDVWFLMTVSFHLLPSLQCQYNYIQYIFIQWQLVNKWLLWPNKSVTYLELAQTLISQVTFALPVYQYCLFRVWFCSVVKVYVYK